MGSSWTGARCHGGPRPIAGSGSRLRLIVHWCTTAAMKRQPKAIVPTVKGCPPIRNTPVSAMKIHSARGASLGEAGWVKASAISTPFGLRLPSARGQDPAASAQRGRQLSRMRRVGVDPSVVPEMSHPEGRRGRRKDAPAPRHTALAVITRGSEQGHGRRNRRRSGPAGVCRR